MKFTESALEEAIIELINKQDISHIPGRNIKRDLSDVLIKDDLKNFLETNYSKHEITNSEIESIVRLLENKPASDLYESNKSIMKMLSDGFIFKREDRSKKDIFIELIDYSEQDNNIYKVVNQLEIIGFEKRKPDCILYINGLPIVVFEFKTAVREEATIYDAYIQITTRYKRDIPELFKYNAFCVISDGVNNKAGSFFAPYDFFYSWRKVTGFEEFEKQGIDSLFTLIEGLFNKYRLRDIIHNFIYFPDNSKQNEKIFCRYPQYYAAKKLYKNILQHLKPLGDGKGGTYFGATGCGKSFTMLFLTRLLMRSLKFSSPTIILITDRNDLDDQLSTQFTNAKKYIGDENIISVEDRKDLREKIKGRESGGVFLTTIQKFTENTELLSNRSNVICISDEAHRTQNNLEQKVKVDFYGVKRSFGFAKYLHDSLPNATYVGFTGTPIDETLDVFGNIVDHYTMTESYKDEITVKIVYQGRSAKVLLDTKKLIEIESYYDECEKNGANEYAVAESKNATARINTILGNPDRIKVLASDFVEHYENRISEGATVKGKTIFVCSSRNIAFDFYKEVIALRPQWSEKLIVDDVDLSDNEKRTLKPIERIKMIMTRDKDDSDDLYKLLGDKKHRQVLDRQFKEPNSNFKIAIVVDMWLTGFDVPFLDTIYIDKPIKRHNLIQTISRVNRSYPGKEKGLVVDYIGIKNQMNLALAHYSRTDNQNFEEIEQSILIFKDNLEILNTLFNGFDKTPYFSGSALAKLECLNKGSELMQNTKSLERKFMGIVQRAKSAYDICCGSEEISPFEKDLIYFYIAIRSIIFKLNKGESPDISQMNKKVFHMIQDALKSDGIEEIFKIGSENENEIDIFDDDYLAKIEKIKLPNTKIKLLQKLLLRSIDNLKTKNKKRAIDFSSKLQLLVSKYNERKEQDVLRSEVLEDFSDAIIDIYSRVKKELSLYSENGVEVEERAFFDILRDLSKKYDFFYPDDRLMLLAKDVKKIVDEKSIFTDWNKRDEIKAELKVELIILLAKYDYPPVDRDEVFKEILEQAEISKR